MPFDATLKDLVQTFVHDFEVQMGLRDFAPLTPLNVDLSTLSAATDVALGHGDPPDRVVDINFQSGPDDALAARLLLYNAALHYRYRAPVHSLVVLLRPAADQAHLTGKLFYAPRQRKGKMKFGYEVVRLWQQPVKRYLEGGLGALPLALLCKLPASGAIEDTLGLVVHQIIERLEREAEPKHRAKLVTATYVLSGLRMSREAAREMFRGIPTMRESTTYQAILDEGRVEGEVRALQKTLLRQGRRKFGSPDKYVRTAIEEITSVQRLERMTDRILAVSTWQDLLETR